MPTDERFWESVNRTEGCWLWTGPLNRNGYGLFSNGSRREVAHRTAWRLSGRELDPKLTLDHLCRVRNCVNPDHLEQVTMRDNLLRGINRAAASVRRETCIYGHPRTPENTRIRTSTDGRYQWRVCRPCHKEWRRRRDASRSPHNREADR